MDNLSTDNLEEGKAVERPKRCIKCLSWILLIIIGAFFIFFIGDFAWRHFYGKGLAHAASTNDVAGVHYVMDHAYPKLTDAKRQKYLDSIMKWSREYDLCPVTVASIIWKESKFNEKCRYQGAIGPMQTIPRYHKQRMASAGIRHSDLDTIDKGVQIGCIVFRHYMDKSKGNVSKALKYYNGCVNAKNPKYVRDVIAMRDRSKAKRTKKKS